MIQIDVGNAAQSVEKRFRESPMFGRRFARRRGRHGSVGRPFRLLRDGEACLAGITAVDQPNSNANLPNMSTASNSNSTGSLGETDIAGTLMVPTEDLDMYIQDLTSKGFTVDSTYNFNDIRAGDEQALLVWTTSGMNLNEIIPALQEITPQLPYN